MRHVVKCFFPAPIELLLRPVAAAANDDVRWLCAHILFYFIPREGVPAVAAASSSSSSHSAMLMRILSCEMQRDNVRWCCQNSVRLGRRIFCSSVVVYL
jgi:hypothetical protein